MLNPLYELLKDSIENNNPYTDKETLSSQLELFHNVESVSETDYNELKVLLTVEEIVE